MQSARALGLSLHAVTAWASGIWVFLSFLFARYRIRVRSRMGETDRRVLWALLAIALCFGLLAGSSSAPEEDDSFYVANAVYSLDHLREPLGFDLLSVAPWHAGPRIRAPFFTVPQVLEYFWAYWSHLTGIPLLFLYHVLGSMLAGAALPIIYFFLFSKIFRKPGAVVVGALATSLSLLVLREGGIGYNAFIHVWIGKAILVLLVLPLVAAYGMQFLHQPNRTNWTLLFLSSVCSVGMSSSGTFLVPSLLLALGTGYLLFSNSQPIKHRFINVCLLGTGALYPVSIGLYLYSYATKYIEPNLEVFGVKKIPVFPGAFHAYLGSPGSATSIVAYLAVIWLAFSDFKKYRGVIGWLLMAILLFLNPFVADFVGDHISSRINYNRLFWILPIPTLIGMVFADIAERFTARVKWLPFGLAATAIAIVALTQLDKTFPRIQSDVPKRELLGKARLHFPPDLKIDPALRTSVTEIIRASPPGPMLAPVKYGISIPMFTSRLPQLYYWFPEQLIFFGKLDNREAESRTRVNASEFVEGGDLNLAKDFESILDSGVRSVILDLISNRNVATAKALLIQHGFRQELTAPDYSLFVHGNG